MGRLDGKVALITGAGSGFGEGMAKSFTKEGAHVIIADISEDGGKRVESEIASSGVPGKAVFLKMDVTKEAAWKEALEASKSKFGKLDIVVNNAGTTYWKKPSIEVTEAEFDKVVAVNMKSIFLSVTVIMPYFVERKSGCYLNTSSVAGYRTRPGQVFYGGTKGWVNVVTQALAAEWGSYGIRVNSVCPLRGATALLEHFSGTADTPEERERFAKSVPLGRMSEVQDISNAAVFLVSEEASFVTGVNFPVDGGRLAV
ncbi:putative alcohol dehydrogenase [Rhizodiscina lignyota]|uniref:Alcohol dehydrogenase n=1 Tax=Rhizodiscina lignyota TaxID=1504668 RepID=A0A9P4M0Y3_9PEZI|nr:putative alcohol dehydrogenase [Rhizodiscina lignyota]